MSKPPGYLVIDVESIGLHGDAFAVGWIQADADLNEIACGCLHVPTRMAEGNDAARAWVERNVTLPECSVECRSPRAMRDIFWAVWTLSRSQGHVLVAECLWPVESNFLARCVADSPDEREWSGPYPFHDIASIRLAKGFDPTGHYERLDNELPAHNPLADARQSARLLMEALGKTLTY